MVRLTESIDAIAFALRATYWRREARNATIKMPRGATS